MAKVIDEQTALYSSNHTLILFGSADSIFLRSIQKKAARLGLKAEIKTEAPLSAWNEESQTYEVDVPCVIDYDTADPRIRCKYPELDVDQIYSGSVLDENYIYLPCVTSSILSILEQYDMEGQFVGVVGRGRASKHLPEYLSELDASYAVLNSKTIHPSSILRPADFIVYATPAIDFDPVAAPVVIDLNGVAASKSDQCCRYFDMMDVGRLTTSLILNRFVRRYGYGKS